MGFDAIILKGGAKVIVDWSQKSTCKKCGALIVWANSCVTGKYMPIVQDKGGQWMSHFTDCKAAAEFRRRRTSCAGDLLDEYARQAERERRII